MDDMNASTPMPHTAWHSALRAVMTRLPDDYADLLGFTIGNVTLHAHENSAALSITGKGDWPHNTTVTAQLTSYELGALHALIGCVVDEWDHVDLDDAKVAAWSEAPAKVSAAGDKDQ